MHLSKKNTLIPIFLFPPFPIHQLTQQPSLGKPCWLTRCEACAQSFMSKRFVGHIGCKYFPSSFSPNSLAICSTSVLLLFDHFEFILISFPQIGSQRSRRGLKSWNPINFMLIILKIRALWNWKLSLLAKPSILVNSSRFWTQCTTCPSLIESWILLTLVVILFSGRALRLSSATFFHVVALNIQSIRPCFLFVSSLSKPFCSGKWSTGIDC